MIFANLYTKMLAWAEHRHSNKYLAVLSMAESSFFPIPVDIMLAPMVLAKPASWWRLGALTTITSVIGGVIGLYIGVYFMDILIPVLEKYQYLGSFNKAKDWFGEWGLWVVFVAGFSPIPYKVFTIAAGSLNMALLPFVVVSLIGRGARFFLVAYLVKISAHKIKALDLKWIERLGWLTVVILVIAILIKTLL